MVPIWMSIRCACLLHEPPGPRETNISHYRLWPKHSKTESNFTAVYVALCQRFSWLSAVRLTSSFPLFPICNFSSSPADSCIRILIRRLWLLTGKSRLGTSCGDSYTEVAGGCRKSWFHDSRFAKRSVFKLKPVCYRLFLHWEFRRHSHRFGNRSSAISGRRRRRRRRRILCQAKSHRVRLLLRTVRGRRPAGPLGKGVRLHVQRRLLLSSLRPCQFLQFLKNNFFRFLGVEHLWFRGSRSILRQGRASLFATGFFIIFCGGSGQQAWWATVDKGFL